MFVKVEVYIPKENVDSLMEALNEKGYVGEGDYDFCFSQTEVTGFWRPLKNSKPFIGKKDQISQEKEIKLEFRIRRNVVSLVKELIYEIHPYEVPVINFIALIEE